MKNNKIHFTIYQLDVSLIWNEIMKRSDKVINLNELCEFFMTNMESYVKNNMSNRNILVKKDNRSDFLLVYRKESTPNWLGALSDYFFNHGNRLDVKSIQNSVFYFAMLSIVNNNVYAITGGRADLYIKKFSIKNFGLHLISKLFKESDPVILELTEAHMQGTKQSTSAVNRIDTTFVSEKDFDKIFKKLRVKADPIICEKLGLSKVGNSEDGDKSYNIVTTDFLQIKKSMSICEYKKY